MKRILKSRLGAVVSSASAVVLAGGAVWFSLSPPQPRSGAGKGGAPAFGSGRRAAAEARTGPRGGYVSSVRESAELWIGRLAGMDGSDPAALLESCELFIAEEEEGDAVASSRSRAGLVMALLKLDYQGWLPLLRGREQFDQGLAAFWLATADPPDIAEAEFGELRELGLALNEYRGPISYPEEFQRWLAVWRKIGKSNWEKFGWHRGAPDLDSLVERSLPTHRMYEDPGIHEWYRELLTLDPGPDLREAYETAVMRSFLDVNPPGALEFIKSSGRGLDPSLYNSFGDGISWVDPAPAIEWLSAQDPAVGAPVAAAVIYYLLQKDPMRASRLTAELPPGPMREACAGEVADYLKAIGDLQGAAKWEREAKPE